MKKILLLVALLVCLLGAALSLLFLNASKIVDHFSPQIQTYLSEALGAKVLFEYLTVELWPTPAVSLKGVEIEDFAGVDFSAKSIDLGLAVWPLLKRRFEATALTVFEPELKYSGNSSALVNRDTANAALVGASQKGEQQKTQDRALDRSNSSFEVNLKQLRLIDGSLLIEHKNVQRRLLFEKVQLSTGISLRQDRLLITALDGSTRYNGMAVAFGVDGFEYSSANESLNFSGLTLSSNLGKLQLRGKYLLAAKKGQIDSLTGVVALQQLERLLTDLDIKVPLSDLSGEARLGLGLNYAEESGLMINGTISVSDAELRYQDQLLTGISAELKISSENPSQHLFSSADLKFSLGRGGGAVEVKGQVDQKLNGEISILSEALKVQELLSFLSQYLPRADELRLENGVVKIEGRLRLNSGRFEIQELTLPLRGVSGRLYGLAVVNLNGEIAVRPAKSGFVTSFVGLDAEIGSAAERLTLSGDYHSGDVANGNFKVSSEKVSFANLAPLLDKFWPAWKGFGLKGAIGPDLEITVAKSALAGASGSVVFDGVGLQAGSLDISTLRGVAKVKSLGGGGSFIESDKLEFSVNRQECTVALGLSLSSQQLQIKSLSAQALGGDINGIATFDLFGQGRGSFRVDLVEVDIESLVKLFADSDIIRGRIEQATLALTSERGLASVESWSGRLTALSKNAVLKDVNLGRMVLEKVDNVPYLSGRLIDRVPEQFHHYFSARDTEIKHLAITLLPEAGKFKVEKFELLTDAYFVTARGIVNRPIQLALDAELVLNEEISNHLVQQVRELRSWQATDQTIAIPFKLSGAVSDIRVRPDVSRLVQRGLLGKVEEILERTTGGRR